MSQFLTRRTIIHADLDAFYASVEQMDDPALRGKPVLVGGNPEQRGVVAACSYEARAFGVRSAMPMRTAVRLCPTAVVVNPRFHRYHEVSQQVMTILGSFSPVLQPVSMDEAYLDVTDAVQRGGAPIELATDIKARVKAEVGLNISLGVGGSKSVAKIACDMSKPDGLKVVAPGSEREFLAPLPVRRLNGVGPRTEERLKELGVATLGDLAAKPDQWLEREFGKRGPELGAMSRGLDTRPVAVEHGVKSISAETTFSQDTGDPQALRDALARLCARVGERLIRAGARGRTATLKLRLSDFTTFTRGATVRTPIGDAATLREVAERVLDRELEQPGRRYRLLGVGVSNFSEGAATPAQLPLFWGRDELAPEEPR